MVCSFIIYIVDKRIAHGVLFETSDFDHAVRHNNRSFWLLQSPYYRKKEVKKSVRDDRHEGKTLCSKCAQRGTTAQGCEGRVELDDFHMHTLCLPTPNCDSFKPESENATHHF